MRTLTVADDAHITSIEGIKILDLEDSNWEDLDGVLDLQIGSIVSVDGTTFVVKGISHLESGLAKIRVIPIQEAIAPHIEDEDREVPELSYPVGATEVGGIQIMRLGGQRAFDGKTVECTKKVLNDDGIIIVFVRDV